MKAKPEFQVSDAGEITLQGITVEAGGVTARGIPSAGITPSVQLATVNLPQAAAPALVQQSAITVDRNQVEQILYREENDLLRKRLGDQRKQQEQALANEQAKAAAEIARIRAEAEALKKQQPVPVLNYAAVQDAHALVIGNSAYPGSNRLANPTNDAKAMTAKLRSLGFKVTEISNATREQMVRGLSEFSKTASRADLTLLFYAGHGVQI
ncbi:MAG: caspase family protein, partial [Betaproteobacteria bacterium]|nr:caspase family protein [Betaproteobacteria bacterium]